jgi:hypothetical protein
MIRPFPPMRGGGGVSCRVPPKHPLRVIRHIVNDVLAVFDGEFARLYVDSGRPSIPPERLLRALHCRHSTLPLRDAVDGAARL